MLSGPLSIGEIAERLRITHVSVIAAVRSLEEEGVVASEQDPADRRRRVLELTVRGRARIRDLTPIWSALERAAAVIDTEVGGVVAVLDRLEDALAQRSLVDRVAALLK